MPDPRLQSLLVVAENAPPDVARTLDLAGYAWKVAPAATGVVDDGHVGVLVVIDGDAETEWSLLRAHRRRSGSDVPVLLLVAGASLGQLELRDELFDDFILTPFHPAEMEVRLRHLLRGTASTPSTDLVSYGELTLNLETYQATVGTRPLDLTYMEYELLKFLAQNPGKVFTREILLSRVWGYEYYGGARTVDVHIRRLRAKLGEEHAGLIQTVRSVGYRFGQSRWEA